MMTSVPTSFSLHPSSNYKEFSEERARRLYEELILQYLRDGNSEGAAATKARLIIKKQCRIRNIDPWPWL
jgi:hypothetical protein